MDLEADEEPTGPMILMLASGEGYVVTIAPAPPTGNCCREFYSKCEAWHYAQSLWMEHRLGFADHSSGQFVRGGA